MSYNHSHRLDDGIKGPLVSQLDLACALIPYRWPEPLGALPRRQLPMISLGVANVCPGLRKLYFPRLTKRFSSIRLPHANSPGQELPFIRP